MKTHSFLLSSFLLFALGCVDGEVKPDSSQVPPILVNFALESLELEWDGTPLEMVLDLNQPAISHESFYVKISGEGQYGQHFTTQPEAHQNLVKLEIEPGQNKTSFVLFPLQQGEQKLKINFGMEGFSEKLRAGSIANSEVWLLPEQNQPPVEFPAKLAFEFGQMTLPENQSEGIEVKITIQGLVRHSGLATVKILAPAGKIYGEDFYTLPPPVLGEIQLAVSPDASSTGFHIFPINDRELGGDFNIQFEMIHLSEGLEWKGPNVLEVKILEDDLIPSGEIQSIASVRDKFEEYEGEWFFPEDYYIQGVVTSASNVMDEKTIFLQDETGGIMLQFVLPSLVTHGDKVQFNLKNASGKYINQQKAITDLVDLTGITVQKNVYIMPETITLEQLATGNYQGKNVRIENVFFIAADGLLVWEGTKALWNEAQTATTGVLTYAHANFSQKVLPSGKLTLSGIAGDWNYLLVQNESEVVW